MTTVTICLKAEVLEQNRLIFIGALIFEIWDDYFFGWYRPDSPYQYWFRTALVNRRLLPQFSHLHSCIIFDTPGLYQRDLYVLKTVVSRGVPVATVIGGGYSRDIDKLAIRHSIVHRAATQVWMGTISWSTRLQKGVQNIIIKKNGKVLRRIECWHALFSHFRSGRSATCERFQPVSRQLLSWLTPDLFCVCYWKYFLSSEKKNPATCQLPHLIISWFYYDFDIVNILVCQ